MLRLVGDHFSQMQLLAALLVFWGLMYYSSFRFALRNTAIKDEHKITGAKIALPHLFNGLFTAFYGLYLFSVCE